ncbi:protein PHYTOCHROME KINASE SUBSTRATE 4-like [Hibiscus syriacus]|uniref:protein PHYTOCHROME KINASE SUBSTRATE 4-like n=1 Tax=Hibiscus syriacus TaxID=106335 RepID=UPI001920B065|nr:protein PHYTOCHROME KINASE SUBSTRATE 4-like [Hibiscus syriacus]
MMMENPRVMKMMNGVQVSADEDTEISIFDVKKYFNESNSEPRVSTLDIPNLLHVSSDNSALPLPLAGRFSSASDGYGYGMTYRLRSFHATPTPSSEASWNSQTGLLSNPTGAIAVSMITTDDRRKRSGKKRWLWRPCCPCSGKKSVQVETKAPLSLNPKLKEDDDDQKRQEIPVIQLTSSNLHSISEENHEFHSSSEQRVVATTTRVSGTAPAGFTFPILNQQPKPSTVKMSVKRAISSDLVIDHEDPPRQSLDVFQPPRKLVSRITVADDDVASDTSSDLFEIESLSTTTQCQTTASTYQMYKRRDSLDEALHYNTMRSIPGGYNNGATGFSLGCPYSPMVTESYEPSEASIDWSVTTAEGFERGSVGVSEAEENMQGIGNYNGGGKKKTGEWGLLSCRSQKAVSVVGPNPVKYVPPWGQEATTTKHVGNVNNPRLSRLSIPFSA